jgi:hypothetical protein
MAIRLGVLLSNVISEVCNSVLGVANELSLGLGTMVLLSADIREDSRDLTV